MSYIYVYDAKTDDFANFGLVGALEPTSCIFEEEANGLSEITLVHPLDDGGKYKSLVCNNLISAMVPVRTTPEIEDGQIITSVEKWTVKSAETATAAMRALYRYRVGGGAIKILTPGTTVTVTHKLEDSRYKVKTQYGVGWMSPLGLDFVMEETIADNSQSIEGVQPAWTVKMQLFRIYNVEKNLDNVTVSARHISYDLLYNLTIYANTGETDCRTALEAILANCIVEHGFTGHTNLANVRTGIDWTRINPINALLDPDVGLTTLYKASLVRDNWELYILHDPGLNRGVTVEYGRNMTGIKYTESLDDIATRIVPVGEKADGTPLLLTGAAYPNPWIDSERINDYPIIYTRELKCEDCTVGQNGVTTALAINRMAEQAKAVFDAGGDLPQVQMSVDFVNLGDTAEYGQYKDLERLFLWDYVTIRHAPQGIDVTSRIVSIQWDCMLDRMISMEVGAIGKTLANMGIVTEGLLAGYQGGNIGGTIVVGPGEVNGSYSESEQYTGIIWIDGKPVYRRVFAVPAIAAGTTSAGNIIATINDMETLIDMRGMVVSRGGLHFPLGFKSITTSTNATDALVDGNGGIIVRTGSAMAIASGYVICEYTRKRDTAVGTASALDTGLLDSFVSG